MIHKANAMFIVLQATTFLTPPALGSKVVIVKQLPHSVTVNPRINVLSVLTMFERYAVMLLATMCLLAGAGVADAAEPPLWDSLKSGSLR